jgi:hypothetical protein
MKFLKNSVFALISVVLIILTIIMFKMLSVDASKDLISQTVYLSKLKFTQLTSILIFFFFISDIVLILNGFNSVFLGLLGWEIYIIFTLALFLNTNVFIFVMFVGMTNWKLIPKYYFCKNCKNSDE